MFLKPKARLVLPSPIRASLSSARRFLPRMWLHYHAAHWASSKAYTTFTIVLCYSRMRLMKRSAAPLFPPRSRQTCVFLEVVKLAGNIAGRGQGYQMLRQFSLQISSDRATASYEMWVKFVRSSELSGRFYWIMVHKVTCVRPSSQHFPQYLQK